MADSRRMLAILAHPDDESFRAGGALALLARRGVRVDARYAARRHDLRFPQILGIDLVRLAQVARKAQRGS